MAMDLEDKVILITGGTGGIGKAAATQLARRGATLVLVGRDPEKGARAAGELRSTTGNDRVEHLRADLSRMSDVRRVAAEFRARHRRLDVLVNNAGAMFGDWSTASTSATAGSPARASSPATPRSPSACGGSPRGCARQHPATREVRLR